MSFKRRRHEGGDSYNAEVELIKLHDFLHEATSGAFERYYRDQPELHEAARQHTAEIAEPIFSDLFDSQADHPSFPAFSSEIQKILFMYTNPGEFSDSIDDDDLTATIERHSGDLTNPQRAVATLRGLTQRLLVIRQSDNGILEGLYNAKQRYWLSIGMVEAEILHEARGEEPN